MRRLLSCAASIASLSFSLACGVAAPSDSPSNSPSTSPSTSPSDSPSESSTSTCAPVAAAALPSRLSQTGLYADLVAGRVCDAARALSPAAALWSDGAEKQRWMRLPVGGVIDASDIDAWSFPRGTWFWKEFVVDGQRRETRVSLKVGDSDDVADWRFASYRWRADGSDADLAEDGAEDVAVVEGHGWDIPSSAACQECHVDLSGRFRVLGANAVLLSEDDQLARLVGDGLLAPAPPSLHAPAHAWPRAQREGLLYLSVNCGHCHQEGAQGTAYTATEGAPGLQLNVRFADADAAHTAAAATAPQPLASALDDTIDQRVVPGDPERSGLYQRLRHRDGMQMPPLGTELVDDDGAAHVAAWILALTP